MSSYFAGAKKNGPEGLALGTRLLDDDTLKGLVSAACFSAFLKSKEDGTNMDKKMADELAGAILVWARGLGANTFAHWFSPMRGANALKYDSLVDLDFSENKPVRKLKEDFSGTKLFVAETDGSSFPNGGLRATHTAAAFNTWDKGSPPFVRSGTLYLPSAFVAWTGAALDEKTPLLRSQAALSKSGVRLLKLIGEPKITKMDSYVGWEQEFFVVSKENFLARPDLVNCGRTLTGAAPPRGQQMDGNYFNAIPNRVRAMLNDLQAELWAIGCALAVMHNEVAPGQHEISPVFSVSNHSSDSNVAAMEIMAEIAERHGLAVLLHEKPFAGINGSGKHNNWSVGVADTGGNCFHPGKTPYEQKRFIVCVTALVRTLNQYGEAVRVGVSGAGNDHRLGAQEAPPAIMSLYTGIGIEEHLKKVMEGGPLEGYTAAPKDLDPGAPGFLQSIPAGQEDRNRTAPFPFCGNRFEFRAVGSSQHPAFPNAIINTALADSMDYMAGLIEGGMDVRDVCAQVLKENMRVVFCGNGYSSEWPVEAASRGLPNLRTTPEAIAQWNTEKNIKLFGEKGVFSAAEMEARAEIMYERYAMAVEIEATTLVQMVNTGYMPACAKDLQSYLNSPLAGERQGAYTALDKQNQALKAVLAKCPEDSEEARANYMCQTVLPQMLEVRKAADASEELIEAKLFPFPKYADIVYGHHF